MSLVPGARVGPYEVVAPLGAGGMGEVYRATDTRLGRVVALKILPAAVSHDAERLRRFEVEAKAVAELSHPNILTIFEFGHDRDTAYAALELVNGVTLRDVVAAGPLPVRKAVDYARQIAQGLAAAHSRGILHRDIKPENIMVTDDGRIKLLDFGLAKRLVQTSNKTVTADVLTESGSVMGTLGYMAPEQMRADVVTERSDVFALGVVLYEMLSGGGPFSRPSGVEVLAAILRDEPPPLAASIPRPLQRIVQRCLEKSPAERYQSAADLAFTLEAFSGIEGGLPTIETPAASAEPVLARMTWIPWLLAAGLVAALGARELWRARPVEENVLAHAQFTRFTDWDGTEGSAEISPDGRFVCFLADRQGRFDLWVKQVGTGDFKNLTEGLPQMPAPGILRHNGFSGDGQEVWLDSSPQKVRMALTGGVPRPFLAARSVGPAWSSDATRLVYFSNGEGDPLLLADGSGDNAHPIAMTPSDPRDWAGTGDDQHNHNPVWSTDDQWIYFVHGQVHGLDWTDAMDVWRVHPEGGAPERLTHQRTAVTFLAPIDARTLLYVARAEDGSGPWLWELDVVNKTTRRVISGLEQFTSVAASHDGRRIVATVANPTASLWTVPILDRQAAEADVQPYPVQTLRALAPRFGGASLFFLSARGTGDGLWRFQNDQAIEVWKGQAGALSDPPAVSRDGQRVVVMPRRDEKQHLTIMSADGTAVTSLAPSIDTLGTADWSPDAKSLVTGGRDAEGPALFLIPVDGGQPRRLVAGEAVNPIWSPDGTLIVYSGPVVGGAVPLVAVRPDGTAVPLPLLKVRPGSYRFLPNGTGLVYLAFEGRLDFSLLDLKTSTSRQLTRLDSRGALRGFDITRDGTHIVFDRSRQNSDIVLIELPKK